MFYAGLDAPEKRRFTFPLCCYPIKLRPATIFWIIAVSDISYSLFGTFIGTLLVMAAPVGWKLTRCGTSSQLTSSSS